MACNINTLLADACTNGFSCLDDRSLKIAVLQLLCNTENTNGASGSGSPEGAVTGSPGKTYVNTANNDFYVKVTGTGKTGWVLKA